MVPIFPSYETLIQCFLQTPANANINHVITVGSPTATGGVTSITHQLPAAEKVEIKLLMSVNYPEVVKTENSTTTTTQKSLPLKSPLALLKKVLKVCNQQFWPSRK